MNCEHAIVVAALPCKCCGNAPSGYQERGDGGCVEGCHWACNDCEIKSGSFCSGREAILDWNRMMRGEPAPKRSSWWQRLLS